MGKNGPKDISDRIKTRGLQKIRWYCSMCLKQCRDENEFKSHCLSEFHQRQMKMFGKDPQGEIDRHSEKFEKSFLDFLKRSCRGIRISATVVYNKFISDQGHVDLNLTRWSTLFEFVEFLGRTGKCAVEETFTGLFITYINQEERGRKRKGSSTDFVEEEKQERNIKRPFQQPEQMTGKILTFEQKSPNKVLRRDKGSSIKAKKELSNSEEHWLYEGIVVKVLYEGSFKWQKGVVRRVRDDDGKIEMIKTKDELWVNQDNLETVIPQTAGSLVKFVRGAYRGSNAKLVEFDNIKKCARVRIEEGMHHGKVLRDVKYDYICKLAFEELMREQDKAEDQSNKKDYWLCEGLVVKVLSEGCYKNEKGVVRGVISKHIGEIEILRTKDVLRVDQENLQTVIPHIGSLVKVVNGAYRGSNARLLEITEAEFCAKVQIEEGMYHGKVVPAVEYEDICKFCRT